MDEQDKFNSWLKIAQYDLETAEAMFVSGRWIYVVFMCQQAIEKLCKGLYLHFIDDDVPKIHDINSLISKYMDKIPVINDDKQRLFAKLSAFYLKNRYPDYKELLNESLSKEEAQLILEKTKEAFTWLLEMKQ
ncbi:MAG: HEPN domain-containing protein [Treponema sp.]|nr:HEPN domain-containing protein [Treponema sp.]